MKTHGGCGCKGAHTYVYTATALGKGRVASPMFGRLYPHTHFIVGAVWIRRSEENLHPSDTQDWTQTVKSITKYLATRATWPLRKPWLEYNHLFCTLKKHIFIVTSPLWTNAFSSFCKVPSPPPYLCHKKKKNHTLPLWVQKALSIFGLKSYNFATCIWTCSVHYPIPPTLVRNTKDSFC